MNDFGRSRNSYWVVAATNRLLEQYDYCTTCLADDQEVPELEAAVRRRLQTSLTEELLLIDKGL